MLPKKIKSKQNQLARIQIERDARKKRLLEQGVSEDRLKKDSTLRHLHADIRKINRDLAAYAEKMKPKEAPAEKPAKVKGGKEGKAAAKAAAKAKAEKPPKPKKVKGEKIKPAQVEEQAEEKTEEKTEEG